MSGYRIREEFSAWDAERVFDLQDVAVEEPAACIGALVLQGMKKPVDCPAFGVDCTPERPLGAPMVSDEGACSAYYRYRRHSSLG
jgi:hydrogenase expression/formation protein HypD